MKIQRFEEIIAWQKARTLVAEVYRMTNASASFRRDVGLREQIRRAAVSAMSNIAEGFGRYTDKEMTNFLNIAGGSIAEVQSQLYVALDLKYIEAASFESLYSLADETGRLLTGFMNYLRRSKSGNERTVGSRVTSR